MQSLLTVRPLPVVIAYVGLGSNVDDPVAQVRGALRELGDLPDTRCIRESSLYLSRPVGPVKQPDFVNAVAALETRLRAESLLARLQSIETGHGRRRGVGPKWGPRPLDLDILLYGDRRIETPWLTLPHREMATRAFVLYPLLEIASPGLYVPGAGPLLELVRRCPKDVNLL